MKTTLSTREHDVAIFISEGATTREVAEALGLSIKTVETYRVNIQQKLRCGAGTGRLTVATLRYLGKMKERGTSEAVLSRILRRMENPAVRMKIASALVGGAGEA